MDISTVSNILIEYREPAIFLGAFFFGETFIITAALLATQGIWSLSDVFLLSFIGTILSDSLWFFFGSKIFHITHRWEKTKAAHERFVQAITKLVGSHPFFLLLVIKFLYGTRILTILYLSMKRMKFGLFFIYNSMGTIIWLSVLLSLGWFIGYSTGYVSAVKQFQYAIFALAALFIVLRLVTKWIEKKIMKR